MVFYNKRFYFLQNVFQCNKMYDELEELLINNIEKEFNYLEWIYYEYKNIIYILI